jgi:1,6-anhydro-N-acetylmuramate kinase
VLSFQDRLRTAQYFSSYIFFFALSHISTDLELPKHFALCGGGWKNPIIREHFEQLLSGDTSLNPVLEEHHSLYESILKRLRQSSGTSQIECHLSSHYGFDGTAMEARIFADAAFCRVTGQPFSYPETTGVQHPTILGIIRYPSRDPNRATQPLRDWMKQYNSETLTLDDPSTFDQRWSRAAAGWRKRL